MRLDLYKRPESSGRYSYLIVPEGCSIPEEANSIDWQIAGNGLEIPDSQQNIPEYAIDHAFLQLEEKGYAITGTKYM